MNLVLRIILIGAGIFLIAGGVHAAGKAHAPVQNYQRRWWDLFLMIAYVICAFAAMGLGLWLCFIGLAMNLEVYQ